MRRKDIILFKPVFEAIEAGKNVQIFDSSDLCYHTRGWWKTVDNWGFGSCSLSSFRIKNADGSIEYFDENSKNYPQRDLDEPEKWVPNHQNYLS